MRSSLLAPFQVRSFRFQYPADLLTSWGSEMENLILGWYILVETGSVLLLTLFGSLQYFGTLVAPVFGMAGDRLGHRTVLCSMRVGYAHAGAGGDGARLHRHAASGACLHHRRGRRPGAGRRTSRCAARWSPTPCRPTALSARWAPRAPPPIRHASFGALAGAGLFAALGLGPAYAGDHRLLLRRVPADPRCRRARPTSCTIAARNSLWRDLREGLAYLWDTPSSLAALWLAFLVNLTAFPMTSGLLPFVARDIYHVDQTGLGYLISSFAFGGLLGSILISIAGRAIRPARMMIMFALAWYPMLLVFVHMRSPIGGSLTLICAGLAQSLSLVPMSAMLLHGAGAYRGRVMGMRMLAIYGLPIGLLGAGALIDRIGFTPTATLYCFWASH